MLKYQHAFLLTIVSLFLSITTNAQLDFSANHNFLVQAEIEEGFSFRYENSILVKDNFLLLGYIGISTIHTTFSSESYYPNTLGIPVGISMVFGKSKNHFETTLGYRWEKNYYSYPRSSRTDEYHLKLGYRFQKLKGKGFIFKAGLTTFLKVNQEVIDVVYTGIDKLDLGGYVGFGYGF